jgi:hypothetical protein
MTRAPSLARCERGQAYTFEGVAAAAVIVLAVVTAMQIAGAPTATTAPTTGQADELGVTVLTTATETGAIRHTLTAWNTTTQSFETNGSSEYYTTRDDVPPGLRSILDEAMNNTGNTANMHVTVTHPNNTVETIPILYQGTPPSAAVTNRHPVTLYDTDHVTAGPADGIELDDATGFYVKDTDPDSAVYALVTVEITVWNTRAR